MDSSGIHWGVMLGLGSALREAINGASRRDGKHEPTVWGDEWAEGSIHDLWYPCNWQNVSDDELTLVIPSLIAGKPNGSRSHPVGAYRLLKRALLARFRRATLALSAADDCSPDAIDRARNMIDNSNVLTAIDGNREWMDSAQAYAEIYGGSENGRASKWIFRGFSSNQGSAEGKLYELTILACLNQFLLHSMSPDSLSEIHRDGYGETEIVLATIHSGLNAAYVYRQFAYLHEQFTLGAWLGHLHRGRPAIMPYFIAETIIERFSRAPNDSSSPPARSDKLLIKYGESAVGRQRLLRTARRVRATGEAVLVNPRKRQLIPYAEFLACVETFSDSVKRHSPLLPAN